MRWADAHIHSSATVLQYQCFLHLKSAILALFSLVKSPSEIAISTREKALQFDVNKEIIALMKEDRTCLYSILTGLHV